MRSLPVALVLLLAPLPARAADDWVGLTVFSTKDRLPLRDASGDAIGDFSYYGTVTRDLGEWVEVRHLVHPGPYVGRVKKSEVVKQADAEKFYSQKIKNDGKDTWAFRNRASARVMDRDYFRSIYFREPGGVLFEIATDRPGFTVDEPLESLGTTLRLPKMHEPLRGQIQRLLPPVKLPVVSH